MKIFKDFNFEAAHHLPMVPKEHKCSRLHADAGTPGRNITSAL